MRPDEIARRIRRVLPDRSAGFRGGCFSAAKLINAKVFDGQGELVAAANKFWLPHGAFYGHVAVKVGEHFWDADARPKQWDEIESWGMLDVHDVDYSDIDGWDEEAAFEVATFTGEEAVTLAWLQPSTRAVARLLALKNRKE